MRLFAGCDMSLQASEPCTVRPTEYVDAYGNLCQRFETSPGPMRIRGSAVVEKDDVIAVAPAAQARPVSQLPDETLQFLLQSRYCPSDKLVGQAQPRGSRIVVAYGRDAADVAFISNHGGLTTTSLQAWVQLDNGQPLF